MQGPNALAGSLFMRTVGRPSEERLQFLVDAPAMS
jgi:hypothetical protein